MASQTKSITIFVDFYIKPDRIEEWKSIHRPIWDAVAHEKECLLFDIFWDPDEPGHFRLVEVWAGDREWFETQQMKKDYMIDLWPKSSRTWEKEMKITYFERLGEGCSYRKGYLEGGKLMD